MARDQRRIRIGATLWVLTGVMFPVQVVVAVMWPDGYSIVRNAISDLGVTSCGQFSELGQQARPVCSPGHEIFNLGLVAIGVLTAVGALLLKSFWVGRIGRAVSWSSLVAGIAVVAVGVVPWDVAPDAHDAFALLQAMFQWVAMLALCFARVSRSMRVVTAGALLLSMAAFAAFLVAQGDSSLPLGIPERFAFDTLGLWVVAMGIWIIRTEKSDHSVTPASEAAAAIT